METVRLSSREKNNLTKYELHKEIENTESEIFLYKEHELLKIIKDKEFLNNKLYVINKLGNLRTVLELEELVLPNSLVKFNKEIAKILKKIENTKTLRQLNFYLGDIHEYNFIYDNKEKHLKVIDIDSSYFDGAKAPLSKFLTYNDKLWDFKIKYPIDDETKNHIPNKNTTILSFIYILLNSLTGDYVPDISISEFYKILNMLNAVGINKELLDMIFNIYMPKDNYIDYELINSITENQYNKFKELQLKK